jgi:hypothetical protein
VQHQLRAHTPDAAKALRATVSTYPTTTYDLEKVLTSLGIGEAIVTVMSDKGAPTPVAWTRLRAPQGSMDPTPSDRIVAAVSTSPLAAKYAASTDPRSASEILDEKDDAASAASQQAAEDARVRKEAERLEKQAPRQAPRTSRRSQKMSPIDRAVGEASRTLARELVKNLFKRRR